MLAPAGQASLRSKLADAAPLAHIAERHGRAGRGLGIIIWFPYRRWFLLVILDLSATIAVRAILPFIYPATAITTWANLHCQHLHVENPSSSLVAAGVLGFLILIQSARRPER